MRETVERILDEKFDYEKGTLEFSTARIELALSPHEVFTGSFFINAVAGRLTEGHVYSNDIRMKLITDSFSGLKSEIGFTYSAMGLEEGDSLRGEIYVISNQGEYYLPYTVTITHESLNTSLGGIKNLFHFTNLAKSNWEEACKLFYSEDFIHIFSGNDLQYKKVYLGLSRFFGNEQNVEEFLVSINKKQPIEYIPEQETLSFDNPEGIVEEYINITRNGWGYTHLCAHTDENFISFEKQIVSDNDFLGNYLSFPVRINSDNLHAGVNFGKVTFFNAFCSFEVKVTVNVDVVTKAELSRHLEYMHENFNMVTYFQALRTKKISADTWIAETEQIVDKLMQNDDKNLSSKLYKAQLLLNQERYNEAKWILDQAEEEFTQKQDYTSSLWTYYLYLTTLYSREENYIDSITAEIRKLYDWDQSDWKRAWLLLYLCEEYAVSPTKKWLFIEENIERGCISPFFYVEAINMLLINAGLLTKLSSFEKRVLLFAARNDLLTQEIIRQFVYVASREREYSKTVFEILKKCYEIAPSTEIISVICELLIKGDIVNQESYEWYLRAILEDARVTKLYEYYMRSLDLNKEYDIPKMVFLYFSYDSDLEWEQRAYLYSRILEKREEMPDVFENYKPMIERFVLEELSNEHINKDMAVLYRFVLSNMSLTGDMAENLSRILFMHKISVSNPEITKAIVYQSHEWTENVYPLKNGVAFVPLYDKDYTVIFEDALSNRYLESAKAVTERLMVPGKLASRILPVINDNIEFDVYALECSQESIEITDETRDRYARILEANEIDDEYKEEIRSKIIRYYYENDCIRELDSVLESLDPRVINHKDRVQAIRYMVIRGMYDKAMSWVTRYGIEGIETKDLVKLASKLIERNEYEENDDLVRVCASVFFLGKYDEVILKYLVANFHGMTKDLRRIFKAAENFDLDLYHLCENMILQMLYTGYYVSERAAIYKRYVQGGANTEIQLAFLTQCSFDYFVKEQLMEPFVFEEITKAELRGEKLLKICKLAYLKYYSETEEPIDDTVKMVTERYLSELLDEGIYMSFFKNFMDSSNPEVNKFSDKTFIEYKTAPGRKVSIHYIYESDDENFGEYITEEMPEMYGGVYVKSFILFFGENLLYYITEEGEGEELLTESASIQKSDIGRELTNSRFNEVNDIVIAKTLQDYETLERLLYDYHKHAYIIDSMFKLE